VRHLLKSCGGWIRDEMMKETEDFKILPPEFVLSENREYPWLNSVLVAFLDMPELLEIVKDQNQNYASEYLRSFMAEARRLWSQPALV